LTHHQSALRDRIIRLRRDFRLRLSDAAIVAAALDQEAALATADRQLLGLESRIDSLRVLAFGS
jgi:predicted nucleic acid-binding protein